MKRSLVASSVLLLVAPVSPERVTAGLNWKVDAAMGCLQGEPLAGFYGKVSAAIGQAASAYK